MAVFKEYDLGQDNTSRPHEKPECRAEAMAKKMKNVF